MYIITGSCLVLNRKCHLISYKMQLSLQNMDSVFNMMAEIGQGWILSELLYYKSKKVQGGQSM
jgi:hypothetical protein